ncbi:hypothetical protein P12x_001414 [Tundrisphaera lichenicola]|uniref:hypothetical protein n=1 Tax=Tundrisphaera lichenicola TaxID=2029860 RepID=UPI003EBA9E17
MPPEPDSDLHWLAFRYATGEMSDPEEVDFERMLADDQSAREALAGAVELSGAMSALPPKTWSRPRRFLTRRTLAWSGLAAAACLAVASLWSLGTMKTESPDAAEVAMAWSDLDRSDPIMTEIDYPESISELEASGELAIPSWILAAAESSMDDVSQEEN